MSNSSILTNKFKFFKLLRQMKDSLKSGAIQSDIFSSPSEFMLETYCLDKNKQLTEFLAKANDGHWVVKNTSLVDGDNNITLIGGVD